MSSDLAPGPPPGNCNPLQPARAGALRAGGLGRPARAWRDEGRDPGSGLYQERIPRRHLRVLGRPNAVIPCITSPLKWFSCGVGGSGRKPIQSADPVDACGAVEKKRSLVRGGVLKISFQELGARGAGAQKQPVARPPGSPGGCAIRCSPHARERLKRRLGDLWIAQDAPPVLRSGRLRASRGLDKFRIEQSCEPTCVFRGRRQWPQAISYAEMETGKQ